MARASFLRQPSYPAKIDPSHPIGRKVTACISPHYGAPHVRPMEMLSGFPATIGAGAINGLAVGPIGKAFRANSTSSGVYWSPPTILPYCDGSVQFSIELLLTFIANDAQFSRLLDCGGSGAGGGVTGGWDFEWDGTGSGLVFAAWNGATPANNTVVAMTAGRTYHVVVTLQPGGNTPVCYVNGQLVTTGTIANITAANTVKFYYSTYRTAGDLSASGTALHFARMYQGTILTPGEVIRLYTRPFEMFRKPRRGSMKAPAAGGAFIPGWAYGATKTIGAVY